VEGNRIFARFFAPHNTPGETTRHIVRVSPQDVGVSGKPGEAPLQEPFAAFISCADARVPVELIFGQQANDLFVVRVAGNVLGSECLGSLDYAVDHLRTVRLVGVLGHTGCGAVTAAVDAYLSPAGYLGVAANFPLQTIVGSLMAPARSAAFALSSVYGEAVIARPGYRQALIEMTVILNAALAAAVLTHNFHASLSDRLQVAYGVYDLRNRSVGLPGPDGEWQAGLFQPPTDETGFEAFGRDLAESRMIQELLDGERPAAAH
jgi:carbonic anhydrase